MVENPFARDPAVTVGIQANTSGFTGAIDDAIAKLGGFKAAAAGVGGALGALAVGGLAASISAAREFNAELRELEKVTDASTAQQLGDSMQRLSEEIPLATTELTKIATAASRFGVAGEHVDMFVETVAKMSAATDLSVDQAGKSFAKLSNLTETPISQIEHLGSAINSLGQTTATSVSEIVDGMLRSSAALSQLGLQQHEIVGLQASLNEVSASARNAGRRLRRLSQDLMDADPETFASALGMTVGEFERLRETDPSRLILRMATVMGKGGRRADQLRSSLTSVSRQALAGLGQNIDGVRENLEQSNAEFEAGTSVQREYQIEANTLSAEIQRLKNRLFNAGEESGQHFVPMLKDAVVVLNDGISVAQSFNEKTDGMAGAMGLASVAAGGLGASLAWLVGGPMAATALGAGLLAAAWTTNFADIQGVAGRTMGNVADILERTLSGANDETQNKLETQLGYWKEWEVRIAAGWDFMATTFANLFDKVMTGLGIIGDAIVDFNKAMKEATRGNFKEAADGLESSMKAQEKKWREFEKRREERTEEMKLRQADRRGALATGDESLLPSSRGQGGGDSALDQAAEKNREAAQAAEESAATSRETAKEIATQLGSTSAQDAATAGGNRSADAPFVGKTTPAIRKALERGVPGYVGKGEIGPRTAITPELVDAMSRQGGVTPEDLGVSREQWEQLVSGEQPTGFAASMTQGSGVSGGAPLLPGTPRGVVRAWQASRTQRDAAPETSTRGETVSSAIGQRTASIASRGDAVASTFASAVDRFATIVERGLDVRFEPIIVEVETNDDRFDAYTDERIDAKLTQEQRTKQRRRGRGRGVTQ